MKAVHEGLRFPCNFCEYKSTCRTGLKNHISSIHEGIKHQCHQCGKQFSQSRILNRHIREFHEGIRMKVKCEFCEYHATKRENLLVHFQKMHKDIPIEIFREKMKSSSRHRGPRKPTEQLPSSNSTPNSISTPSPLQINSTPPRVELELCLIIGLHPPTTTIILFWTTKPSKLTPSTQVKR